MPLPIAVFRSYPSRSKNVVWQKFKTFKDKTLPSTKTGLGDSLKASEKAWAKISWDVIDIKKRKATSLKAAQDNLVKARAMLVIVGQAKVAIEAAHTKALTTKKNTHLSSGALNQVEVIVNGLAYGLTHLKQVTGVEDEFKAEVKRLGG